MSNTRRKPLGRSPNTTINRSRMERIKEIVVVWDNGETENIPYNLDVTLAAVWYQLQQQRKEDKLTEVEM